MGMNLPEAASEFLMRHAWKLSVTYTDPPFEVQNEWLKSFPRLWPDGAQGPTPKKCSKNPESPLDKSPKSVDSDSVEVVQDERTTRNLEPARSRDNSRSSDPQQARERVGSSFCDRAPFGSQVLRDAAFAAKMSGSGAQAPSRIAALLHALADLIDG